MEDDRAGSDVDGPDLPGPDFDRLQLATYGERVDAGADNGTAGLPERSPVEDGADGELHPGSTAELDIDGSLLDTIEEELADVERALALLDEGGYGRCEACGGTIDDDVLTRTPTARFCAEHLPLTLR